MLDMKKMYVHSARETNAACLARLPCRCALRIYIPQICCSVGGGRG